MRTASIFLLLALAARAQSVRYGCEPPAEVAAAISRVASLRLRNTSDDFVAKAREVLRPIVRAYPDEVFANLEYLSLYKGMGHDEIIRGYRLAMEAHEGDPRYALFYAASLIGNNTPEALRRLTVLASAEFPYPYWLIGQIHSYPKFKDSAALSTNLIRFVQACPSYLHGYQLLADSGSGDELSTVAARLRAVLKGRTDSDAVTAYRWLWPIEFRATPPAGHPALRLRIAQDIEELGLTQKMADPEAVATLREGYRISGNSEALRTLPVPAARRVPVYDAERQWHREHPFPGKDSSREEATRYYRALAQVAQGWIALWPDEPMPYLHRFSALSKLMETSEGELATAGEQLVAINRKRPGRFLRTPAVIDVARAYVERAFRVDEVPGLIDTGLREAEQTRAVPEYDLFDDRNHRLNEESRLTARIQARTVLFDWAVKTSKLPSASEGLDAMRRDLDELGKVTTQRRSAQFLEAEYWTKKARLADLEGRSGDAAEHRRAADNARNLPVGVEDPPEAPRVSGKPLPPFRGPGLDGRVWTTTDLAGKVAVVNVWATWCAPCIEELPHVQKLYETLKERLDVVLLTLNVDANPGVVEPFLKGRGWTFPVVLAHDYVEQVLPDLGIPRTWIVESGIVRSEDVGFEGGAGWMTRMLARIEDAKTRR